MRTKMKHAILIALMMSSVAIAQDEGVTKVTEMMEDQNAKTNKQASEFISSVEMSSVESEVPSVQLYKAVDSSSPAINQTVSAYTGDRILHSRSGYFADCIKPRFATEDSFFGARYEIRANVLVCKTNEKADVYTPSYINFRSKKRENINPVTVKKNRDGTFKVCVSDFGASKACKKDATLDELQMKPAFIVKDGSFQRSIEYIGVNSGVVKFVYSEYIDGLARDAYTRSFEIDLKGGRIAAWKGAVFEIVEANNAGIEYKVVRHFPNVTDL